MGILAILGAFSGGWAKVVKRSSWESPLKGDIHTGFTVDILFSEKGAPKALPLRIGSIGQELAIPCQNCISEMCKMDDPEFKKSTSSKYIIKDMMDLILCDSHQQFPKDFKCKCNKHKLCSFVEVPQNPFQKVIFCYREKMA